MKNISFFVFILVIILLTRCNNQTKPTDKDSLKIKDNKLSVKKVSPEATEDSISLYNLVVQLYKWHITDTACKCSFTPLKKNPSDTLYTDIDLDDNEKVINKLKQTGLFNTDFLVNYRKIALRMDKELRDGTSLWREGELSTFGDDSDAWCNCQDYPVDDYWKIIRLTPIQYNVDKSEAIFKWTWGGDFYYEVKAKKESNNWKISYLQGFDMNAYSWEWWKKNKH